MVDLVQGFLAGQEYQEVQKSRQQAAAEAFQRQLMQQQSMRKQARIDEAITAGNMQALMQEGAAGLTAAESLQKFQDAQQAQAMDQYKNAYLQVQALPESERPEAYQFLIGSAASQGLIEENIADQLSFAARDNTEQFVAGMDQLFEIEDPQETALVRNIRAAGIDPASEEGRRLIAGSLAGKSQRIDIDPDGKVTITEGAATTEAPTDKTVIRNLQTEALQATGRIDEYERIAAQFDPDFLKGLTRLGLTFTELEDQFGTLDEADRQRLQQFTEFKTNAIQSLNNYIRDLTGAALSEAEATRLRQGIPDPGEGVFDGDSPTVFKTKLNTVLKNMKLARARAQYALNQGKNWENITLGRIEDILRKEERKFFEEEGWTADLAEEEKQAIIDRVRARMEDEYGL